MPYDKEKNRVYGARYRAKNKEKLRQTSANWNAKNRELAREYHLKRKYGLTSKEWDILFSAQGFRCVACGIDEPRGKQGWNVDHCHRTGAVRGILCQACNVAIGFCGDSIKRLTDLIKYLEKHV